ncbi:VWA domain-containing protein [Luteolibacter arcticus]|uniref:VWA domain-containing protein n=1 Tax=Luteolibacter arcticus TaxID=1581411 RepID=A0ABT3GD13_9BACT|nr:VWA domain-containing protein [Luteolibacter arcticus]MCW1921522.1 VWA domain-containing protein [Luteolibacter arcticus]
MTFGSPEWFLLVPAFLFIGWFWKSLRLWSPLRLLLVLLAAFGLADPKVNVQEDALDLFVLLDRSDSTENLVDKNLVEWKRLLDQAKPSHRDEAHYFDYGAEIVEQGSDGTSFTGSRKLTRTGLALSHITALAKENRPARVLVFTDGFATEPLHEAAEQLQARGIPVDFRLIREETLDDFRLSRLELPERVQAGEPFLIAATVRGSSDTAVNLILRRGGQTLTETKVKLLQGVGRVEFTDRISRAGAFQYEAEVVVGSDSPFKDAHPGNNKASRWIEIAGGPRVLLVTKYADDPVAKVLASLDFTVDVVTNPADLRPGRLTGARAVIFNNVPAFEVPNDFLDALDFFVREQAGGFLMAGGKQSFGSGGYFQSSIDALLPVSMELKSEHRKLSVALAIVLDRSGSMSVGVGGGMVKMDLANNGAADAIGLLGPMDQVCVLAVDSAPETIIPLTEVKANQAKLQARARSVKSQGGGIFVYEGLKAAWDELKTSKSGTRHVILFSDANDSEEPGDYKRLLGEMKKEGCTVSVIGMGTKADVDSKLLEDIAKLGDGRIFFADQPVDIPRIFAQETVTIARSAFVEDPVGAQPTGRWAEISPKLLDWLPEVDGYNLSYLREDATHSLVSKDEYIAPLVAHAHRGLGRSAAVSFPLGGEFSQRIRDWKGYGDFVQTMTRFLMGTDLPPGIGLKHRLDGTRLTLDLLYDPEEWSQKLSKMPPKLRLLESGPGAAPYDVPWKRIAPGHFSVTKDLDEGAIVRGAIQVGEHALPFGPVTVGSSVEWAFEPERLAELRTVSAQTGGRELINLKEAWLRPPNRQDVSLRLWIALSMLGFLVLEALLTRTGWKMPLPAMPNFAPREKVVKPKKVKAAKAEPVFAKEEEKPVVTAETPSEESAERRSRYQRAKDRK